MLFRYALTPMILAKLNNNSCILIQDFDPNIGVNLVFFLTIPGGFDVGVYVLTSSMVGVVNMYSLLYVEDTHYIQCYHVGYYWKPTLNLKPTLCASVEHFGALNACPAIHIVGFGVCMLLIISLSPIRGLHSIKTIVNPSIKKVHDRIFAPNEVYWSSWILTQIATLLWG